MKQMLLSTRRLGDRSDTPLGTGGLFALAMVGALLGALLITAPAGAGGRKPRCLGRSATIVGNARDNDTVFGRGGNDRICMGAGGFDVVFAGGGDDRLSGGKGLDIVFSARGDDFTDGGGARFDMVTYEGQDLGVHGDLTTGVVQAQGTDTVRDVESLGRGVRATTS